MAEALKENSENNKSIATAPIYRADEKGTDSEEESELDKEEYDETVEAIKDKKNELAETEDELTRGEEEAELESGVTSGGRSKRFAHRHLAKKPVTGKVLAIKKSTSGSRSKRSPAPLLRHHHHHGGHSF